MREKEGDSFPRPAIAALVQEGNVFAVIQEGNLFAVAPRPFIAAFPRGPVVHPPPPPLSGMPSAAGGEAAAGAAGGAAAEGPLPPAERLAIERAIACALLEVVYDASSLVRCVLIECTGPLHAPATLPPCS